MLPKTEPIATAAQNWLTQFETALARPDDVPLKTLFHADSYWRDLLALTWRIQTVNGADAILRGLKAHIGSARPAAFRIDPGRAAPRHVTRAGTEAIEAIFTFETAEGRGNGVAAHPGCWRWQHAESVDVAHSARRNQGVRRAV